MIPIAPTPRHPSSNPRLFALLCCLVAPGVASGEEKVRPEADRTAANAVAPAPTFASRPRALPPSMAAPSASLAAKRQNVRVATRPLTLSMRDTPIAEIFDMLARSEKLNIVLGKDVKGNVSVSLHDVTVDQAVRATAEAGGFVAEQRGDTWLVVSRSDMGKEEPTAETSLATYRLIYALADKVAPILTKHLSRYGKVTPLKERNMIVVEDRPEVLAKLGNLVRTLDSEPRQILLEAQILEISLDKSESFGIDWRQIFGGGKYRGSFGTGGQVSTYTPNTPTTSTSEQKITELLPGGGTRETTIASSSSTPSNVPGTLAGTAAQEFFATVTGSRFTAYLSALATNDRVRTLSTPRLLVMEGEKAHTQIGMETGYKTAVAEGLRVVEKVEFLPSGIILRVTPTVDSNNRILMTINPEVSSVTLVNGIPNKTTTTVQTSVLANDGETVFIGGLIKTHMEGAKDGVPILHEMPLVGSLFGKRNDEEKSSETIILITPRLVAPGEAGGVEFAPSQATREFIEGQTGKIRQSRPLELEPLAPREPPG